MWFAKFENLLDPSKPWQSEFKTEALADAWIAKHKGRLGRGAFSKKNLSNDEEWKLKELQEKRRAEYPTELEVIEALIEEAEGKPEKLTEIMMKRNEVKLKYPKEKKK